ncbi:MAG: DUF1351 domain-containing protein [Ruminococcus sp.]|nr:DUF1351 domain-containing protein [Ruminococcus sp.]
MANLELKIKAPQTQPVVFNYEELHTALEMKLADYKDRVYDETMIAEAKSDTANLNKLKKTLSDERISRKKDYMKPFEKFEEQIKELCDMIDEATSGIKAQLDTYEQKRIEEKRIAIRELFSEIASNYDALDFITLEKIYNPKWENKSVTDKAIATEITEVFEKAGKDLEIISKMPYYFEAKETYKLSLDLNKALAEGERQAQVQEAKRQEALHKAQEEIEARKHIEELNQLPKVETEITSKYLPEAEPTFEVAFKVRITKQQARELADFCTAHGITLHKI